MCMIHNMHIVYNSAYSMYTISCSIFAICTSCGVPIYTSKYMYIICILHIPHVRHISYVYHISYEYHIHIHCVHQSRGAKRETTTTNVSRNAVQNRRRGTQTTTRTAPQMRTRTAHQMRTRGRRRRRRRTRPVCAPGP